jgi:hypothetical protein
MLSSPYPLGQLEGPLMFPLLLLPPCPPQWMTPSWDIRGYLKQVGDG